MIDALYETMLTLRSRPLLLDQHLGRMEASASRLGFTPIDVEAIETLIASAATTGDGEAMMRIVAQRDGAIELMSAPLPQRVQRRRDRGTVTLLDSSWQRESPRHKSWPNDINERALVHAAARECDEAIYVTRDGMLLEGTSTNIFVSRGGRTFATPRSGAILPGVIRRWVLEHSRSLEIDVVEDDIDATEIFNGGFLTSSLTLFASISGVDGVEAPADRDFTSSLRERFLAQVTTL